MNLYNYPLISPFDISCHQEVKSIYNQVPQVQEVTCDRGSKNKLYFGQCQYK